MEILSHQDARSTEALHTFEEAAHQAQAALAREEAHLTDLQALEATLRGEVAHLRHTIVQHPLQLESLAALRREEVKLQSGLARQRADLQEGEHAVQSFQQHRTALEASVRQKQEKLRELKQSYATTAAGTHQALLAPLLAGEEGLAGPQGRVRDLQRDLTREKGEVVVWRSKGAALRGQLAVLQQKREEEEDTGKENEITEYNIHQNNNEKVSVEAAEEALQQLREKIKHFHDTEKTHLSALQVQKTQLKELVRSLCVTVEESDQQRQQAETQWYTTVNACSPAVLRCGQCGRDILADFI
ncbi:hypothetical protein AGDE_16879 [Angomonas deanei]|uniref:Uncharacterized protein n=1 Tax=Angomonas deanei TaxID=59799 RepID=A0A7G2C7C2_9TRYP|nr:hypothetical protein AGDE_16879 [Angomonas deanei]CAD2213872.1 hypothetical protein, conserved [Angomonas deanei]|eukprot:EPY15990.1 hypothetical protein AGDE_16879 [Angomonas deanei]